MQAQYRQFWGLWEEVNMLLFQEALERGFVCALTTHLSSKKHLRPYFMQVLTADGGGLGTKWGKSEMRLKEICKPEKII